MYFRYDSEAAILFLERRQLPPARESLVALGFESLFPVADEVVLDTERAGRLGDGVAVLGDELNGLRLEFGCVGTSHSSHDGPPRVSIHP